MKFSRNSSWGDSHGEQVTDSPGQTQGRFDEVVRDFIDFVNLQVGVYMDAMAGFAGHHVRVERQVHRISRRTGVKPDGVIVYASYEDPSQPDIVLNRILRAGDYLALNASGGGNEQQHARAVLIFLITYWEDSVRPRLAAARNCQLNDIKSDIMGDLRVLRNVVLHSKGVMRPDKHRDLKLLGDLFKPDQPVRVLYEDMHRIFVLIKQECVRLMQGWLGDASINPTTIKDIAIQFRSGLGEAGAAP